MPIEQLASGRYGAGRWSVGYVYTVTGSVTHIRVVNTTGVSLWFRLIETSDDGDVPNAKHWARTVGSQPTQTPTDDPIVTAKTSQVRIKQGGEIPGPVTAHPRRGFMVECALPAS